MRGGRAAGIAVLLAAASVSVSACATGESAHRVTVTADPSGSDTPQSESPVEVATVDHAGNRYRVVTLPVKEWDIRVEWPDADGVMLRDLLADEPDIVAATNAGIFSDDLTPGGLLISNGEELRGLNLNEGGGNFHLLPNAVFGVTDEGTAGVVESSQFDATGVTQATQSGPALLLDGEVHPEFNEGSANLAVRNGVGVSPDGATVYLAISLSLTNLWDFAGLFAQELGVEDALYLDGDISSLWVAGDTEPGPVDGPYAGVITVRER